MVRPERFELPAFWFVARRSIQLSYGRMSGEKFYHAGRIAARIPPRIRSAEDASAGYDSRDTVPRIVIHGGRKSGEFVSLHRPGAYLTIVSLLAVVLGPKWL